LAARSAAPALMAGNVVLFKHDPHVPACAEALAEHAAKALPPGILQAIFADTVGTEKVMRDKRVQAVSFTGSTRAGKIVSEIAGSELKPAVLELGGSDPAIVLRDAALDDACKTIVTSRIINAGQSCIAAKRILVEKPIYAKFVEKIRARLEALKVGDPSSEDTDVGPLARADLRENLHRQVTQSISAGAKCLLGGELPNTPGYFYPPTLLTDVPTDSPAFCEETFGPVAVVIPVEDAEQAISLANQTEYGLAAAVWCDSARGEEMAARLETGQVAVNGIVKTDPRLPSGGVKNSGLGRDLGPHGIREFVNIQQVWVGPARPV
ncbi:MAG: aldehyde dehydrogenase family protein, partial [Rhodospirillaceae bacterium]